jgi:hypothetical protein
MKLTPTEASQSKFQIHTVQMSIQHRNTISTNTCICASHSNPKYIPTHPSVHYTKRQYWLIVLSIQHNEFQHIHIYSTYTYLCCPPLHGCNLCCHLYRLSNLCCIPFGYKFHYNICVQSASLLREKLVFLHDHKMNEVTD